MQSVPDIRLLPRSHARRDGASELTRWRNLHAGWEALSLLVSRGGWEGANRGAVEHRAIDCEVGAVAWAIPAPLKGVPVHMATDMCASRRDAVKLAVVIAICRDLLPSRADDGTLTRV